MKKAIRFLLSGVLCTAVMALTLAIVNGKCNLTAAANEAGNLRLIAKDCNVRVVASNSSQIKYDYDKAKFSITTSDSGETTNISVQKKFGRSSAGSSNMISIYIPDNHYKTIIVDSEKAGISLPELNVNFNLTSKNGALSIAIPADYNKTIRLNMINGSGSMSFKQSDKNFRVSVKNDTSAVAIPKNWPAYHANSNYSYSRGTGAGSFVISLKNTAFAISDAFK